MRGTIGNRVHVEVSIDDTAKTREDEKLLVTIDGSKWDVALGRITLELPPTRYLLFNKKGLGLFATGNLGRTRVQVFDCTSMPQSFKRFPAIEGFCPDDAPPLM